ncbi:MAG TPA: PRC-barrel domain-containing protein [Clostridia bacterium]|nr:PRC-barrel domain-containing protein [Clostridia bacterium]
MLHRYSEVLNLPVICADSGKKAGAVKDILFSRKNREVKALLLEHKGLTLKKRVVFISELLSLGGGAAIVNSSGCVSDLNPAAYAKAFDDEGSLLGIRVFSKSGGEIGVIRDVMFDIRTGRIEGLEISDGLFQDVIQGWKLLPLFGKVELGEEFAIVDSEAVNEMEETGGGIKNKLLK